MKKILFFFSVLVASTGLAQAQTDTIFTNNEKISCSVKEVTPDAVKFAYPGEDIVNSVYKNTVQKIVFKSGRVQVFAETTSFKTVKGANDFENVTMTSVQSEVNGLFKLGEVSSKARGTTAYASMEKVKERAYKKAKITAAMMGANIIYLTQNTTEGNTVGSKYQSSKPTETNVAGVAYSNQLPIMDNFNKAIGDKKDFKSTQTLKMSQRDADMDTNDYIRKVNLTKIYNETGLIMVNAKIEGIDNTLFRVTYFDATTFTLMYKDGEVIYNFVIQN